MTIKYKQHLEMKKLFDSAQKCNRCYPNKKIKIPYFEPKNGSKDIKIIFINERPGRLGPEGTGLVTQFNNDLTAKNFRELFLLLNVKYKDIFITNTCLCYLPYIPVNNQHPKIREIINCHY